MQWFFGQYIQRLLDGKGWKPAKLHEVSNLSNTYIGKLIKGKSSHSDDPPSVGADVLLVLADSFGVSEFDLLLAYQGIDPDKEENKSKRRPKKAVKKSAETENDDRYDHMVKAFAKVLNEVIPDEAVRTQKLMEILALPPKK